MEQKDPSMEEILSSIRTFLSKEEPISKGDLSIENKEINVPEPKTVELTEDMMIQNNKSTLKDFEEENIQEETASSETIKEDSIINAEESLPQENAPLVSEPTLQASAESLSDLAKVIDQEKDTPIPHQTSLEGLVSQLLKPYLKEWLNNHLPEIVEKAVQKEIRRVTERAEL